MPTLDVVLVDKHDYHTFQPLLYQVATDLLEPITVGHALRDLFRKQRNLAVHQATVTAIDLDARKVQFAEMEPLTYDYLVLGLGAEVNFFGTEGAAEHAFPMYTLRDALRLREHVLQRWEAADRDESLVDDGALNIVVVGGGPTGVESAGALGELYRNIFVEDYPQLPQEKARNHPRRGRARTSSPCSSRTSATTRRRRSRSVVSSCMLGELVASIAPTRVTLKSGTVLRAHTLVWGAGLQGNPIVTSLGLELERGNRVPVGPDLSVSEHPEVFAVGDVAAITDPKTKSVLPQLGSVALQAGDRAGENIARRVAGKETEPFAYHDKGTMATIGRGAAVIQMPRGRTMKGRTASLAWGAVHLSLLSTGEDRAKAIVDWTWAGITHERPGRITVRTDEAGDA